MSRRNWYLITNALVVVWLVVTVVAVTIHRFVDEPLWLMIHVPLLGAASAAILIWSQHFSDTLLRCAAPLGRAGLAVRLLLHTVGVTLLIVGILASATWLAVLSASIVALAIILHAVILTLQYRGALPARFRPLVRYYVAASIVFLGGIAVGVAMAVTADPELDDRWASAHVVLNAFGWIGLTVLGTLVLLWPTVLHARIEPSADSAARSALPLLLAGIVVAVVGPMIDVPPLVTAGMAVWLVAAGRLGVEGVRQARSLGPATFSAWSLASAYGWLMVAAAALAVIALVVPEWEGIRSAYLTILPPLVVGFGLQIVIGALSFLLPVVALGSPAAAKAGAEMMDAGAAFRVVVINGAIVLYLLPMPSVARVLLSIAAASMVVAFVYFAVRAIVVGRRVRRVEGSEPDRGSRVSLGVPGATAPAAPPRRVGAVTAAFTVLALCVAGGVAADPAATGISVAVGASDVVASGETTEVTVRVEGMRFVPAEVQVPYGNVLIITFDNTGDDVHDLTFANGIRTQRLAPGSSETLDVGLVGADLDGWCSIAGHRQMGMQLSVVVTGAPDLGEPDIAAGDVHDPAHGDAAASSSSASDDIDLARQPEPGFSPWPAALQPAPETDVHRVTLRVTEQGEEVAPGVRQERWTFGGSAPGPVLRGSVGDRFEITLVNDGSIGHSIDFHAGALAPDEPMRTIPPGETLTYSFTATRAGIWMYHCSTMPMSMHIANGMYGAVIIDPPDLAPVDREFVLVQGELYLGPQGETADAEAIAAQNPDLVTFNGYANQYVFAPLSAAVGERVRVWVLDAGPNRPTSFHIVGAQFDTVYLEGDYRLQPGGSGGAQALALQPAQGGFVELEFAEPGTYPFVTHIMSDAEKGATGRFVVD
jgi:nitrite reductase (NO-forming)